MKLINFCLIILLIILISACKSASEVSTQGPSVMGTSDPSESTILAPAAFIPSAASTIEPGAKSMPAVPKTMKYNVKPGETCSMIAVAHQINLNELVSLNPGFKCSTIKTGDILMVPVTPTEAALIKTQVQLNQVATSAIQPTQAMSVPTTKPVQAQPTAIPIPTAIPPTKAAANCSPAYPGVCIPPPPPDLDCKDIPFKRFKVLPPDPHRFDNDHNGIGCES